MHARHADGAAREFMPQAFCKSAHCKLARGIRWLARRSDQSENARQVDDVGPLLLLQHGQKILHAVYDAPKIDVHQPPKIIQRDFLKRAFQRHSRIIDERRYAPMPAADVSSESTPARFLAD